MLHFNPVSSLANFSYDNKKREEVDLMFNLDQLSQIITQLLANNSWIVYSIWWPVFNKLSGNWFGGNAIFTRRFVVVFMRIDRRDKLASIKHRVSANSSRNC